MKRKSNEFGSVAGTVAIRKQLQEYAADPVMRDWISVFTAESFQKIMTYINEIAEMTSQQDEVIALNNFYEVPEYRAIVDTVSDLVIWCNNFVVSPFRKTELPDAVKAMHWYPKLSAECNRCLDAVQNHLIYLVQLIVVWLKQETDTEIWQILITNFVEILIIHSNTEYITRSYFFKKIERPDPEAARYAISAQLTAFERIRQGLNQHWTEHLNDLVCLINRLIIRPH